MSDSMDEIKANDGPPIRQSGRRRRVWIPVIVVIAVVVIAVILVGGWYIAFWAKVHSANQRVDAAIEQALAIPPPSTLVGVPQTSPSQPGSLSDNAEPAIDILVMANDARPGIVEGPGSSDVIMVFHVDRARNYLSVLSITRDLYLDIPGYGKDRVNSAYYRGGPALTIATLKQSLGLNITKCIGVGFEAFPGIVDSLGGVYVDVDRQYTDTPYWALDIPPGYQLLDGANALLFARYRFDQNADYGRMARQRRILSGLRDQAAGWNALKMPQLVNRLLGSATTNLSANELLRLAYWLVNLDGERIKQVTIRGPGTMIDGKSVIVVDQSTLASAVTDFLTPPGDGTVGRTGSRTGPVRSLVAAGDEALQAALAISDAAVWQAAQRSVPFALEAPAFVPEGFVCAYKMPKAEGTYGIKVDGGTRPAVRMVYRYKDSDLYLGVSATTWIDAPIARDGREVEMNGVAYHLVGTSRSVSQIWWTQAGVLYFISNTLMSTVDEESLLKMAGSMVPVGQTAAPAG